jgi:hypothetical protein
MAKFNMVSAYYLMGNRNEAERIAGVLVSEFPEMKTKIGLLFKQ